MFVVFVGGSTPRLYNRNENKERVSFLTELHVHPNNQTKIPQYTKIGPNHRIGYIAYSDNALQTL